MDPITHRERTRPTRDSIKASLNRLHVFFEDLMPDSRTERSFCDTHVSRSDGCVLRLLLVRGQEARGVNRALPLLQTRRLGPGGRRTSSPERRRMLPRELAARMPSSCGLRTGSTISSRLYTTVTRTRPIGPTVIEHYLH